MLLIQFLCYQFQAETEDSGRIEALHKEISEVEEDIDKHVHYSRQLEYILHRLKKNQLKFDAHMVGMEQSMNGIVKVGPIPIPIPVPLPVPLPLATPSSAGLVPWMP